MLSAIQLVDDEPSSKSSDSPTSTRTPTTDPTTSPLSSKKNPTGVVVGGVVGGLVTLAVTISCVFLCRRRHRQGSHAPLVVDEHSPRILTPFMATLVPAEIAAEHHINQVKDDRCTVDVSRGQSSASPRGAETDPTSMDVQIEATTPLGAVVCYENRNPLHAERGEDMPTEELLRLLNQRLLQGRWNDLDDELPPEYDEGRTT